MGRSMLLAAVVAVVLLTGMPATSQQLPPGGTFVDDDGNAHEGYIEAVAAAQITAGCYDAGTRYCPYLAITRGQMATFLARALGLSDAGHPDVFVDDDGSVHEPWINTMAVRGVTTGCDTSDPTLFCPDEAVNRGQMATFLVRAIAGLDPAATDVFSDDDGSVHERNIDGIALAGVTHGCSTSDPTRFCPGQPVRRDQMATFLGRALGLTPTVPPARIGFECAEVIGFSQTNEWYRPGGVAFESIAGDAQWQLRWQSSAYVQLIADPSWPAWAERPESPCDVEPVDRVVLTISGLNGSAVPVWASHIADAVHQVRLQHPYAREIVLQPVVGGPDDALCWWAGQVIRASYQHPYIDQAIADVAAAWGDVVVGFSPEVPDCGGYRDSIGHLTSSYHGVIGAAIGEFYAGT